MFKLESYITPILLSYVDKYIKNFRPEDSQVSLWGGDASFHNLDLRLEVLEQELQLPFSFVSGHVHELLIHVPWTKLNSEPITITINTIECILKLRGEDTVGSDSASHASTSTQTTKDSRRRPSKRQQDMVAPPGYVQSLVNKIVSNITIYCNNLILKYVEEDIVLSVNVKTVTFQSANESWQAAFTDLSPKQVMLRKLVNLSDLTICLDKRNASGKIEMYQEPLLYRCSMELHLLRSYHSATAKRASITRVDIHCKRMDFSLTEQQVPMLMRLIRLGIALHGRELRPDQSQVLEEDLDNMNDPVSVTPAEAADGMSESWAGWAWSWIPSVMPVYWEEDWASDQSMAYAGHTYHSGFYVEQATVCLKVTESAPDRSYYGPRKVKFIPFLIIHLQGCFVDFLIHGAGWLNVQTGLSRVVVEPFGDCFCGVKEASNGTCSEETSVNQQDLVYLASGCEQNNYISESLFDPNSSENKGEKKNYNVSWDYHLATVTEALLLEKSPAFAVDYLYLLEIPDDFNSERLSDLGSDLEYSNLAEKSLCRVVVGPTVVKVCSGLFHRLQMIQHSANLYDYSPYSTPKPEPTREQLPPASAEDFDSLDNNIPKQVYQVTLFKPVIHIHLADHPVFDPVTLQVPRKLKKTKSLTKMTTHLPKVTLECQCLDARVVRPMYPRRLITTTCQLPNPPQHMFHACHFHTNVKLLGVSSHLVLCPGSHTTFLMPSNLAYTRQRLLLSHYWSNPDIPLTDQTLRAESLTVTCTKAKLMVISSIIQSQFDPSTAMDIIQNSSLLADASKHAGVEYLEVCVEEMSYRQMVTPGTKAFTLSLGAMKAFVLEFPLAQAGMKSQGAAFDVLSEPQQALVLSGPENQVTLENIDGGKTDLIQQPLLCLTLQCTRDPSNQDHPPVLIFNLREVRACVDPMMWRWLRYSPDRISAKSDFCALEANVTSNSTVRRSRRLSSEANGLGIEVGLPRRAPTPQESVHSSSDREQMIVQTGPSLSPVAHSRGTQSESAKRVSTSTIPEQATLWSRTNLLKWFPVWRGLVLSGDMAQCVIYLPTTSLSAVGAQSIEDALAQCLHNRISSPPEVLVLTFPFLTLRSSAQKHGLHQYTSRLPVKLPDSIWSKNKVSFPWSLTLSNLSCYTLQKGTKLHFLKPVSANATVAISTKYQNDDVTLGSLGLCVHVDTTPVNISISQEQMILMASVLVGLLEFSSSLQFFGLYSDNISAPAPDPPTPVSPTIFPESSGSRESPTTPLDTEESNEQKSNLSQHSDGVKMTVWMQSTLARLTISLYAVNKCTPTDDLKLTVDMEDIMTSLDLQQVYLKLKCKVAYASIMHYVRKPKTSSWKLGPYVGLVMRRQEDLATSPPHAVHRDADDGTGFLSVTFTRAKCNNVHSRWGTRKQATLLANTRSSDCNSGSQTDATSARYISEIVVKLQPVDFVLSAETLSGFINVLYPVIWLPERKQTYIERSTVISPTNWTMQINNNTLPLLYLDTRNIRIMLPASDLTAVGDIHDVCLIQLETITLRSQADNPLGRVVVRTDIYHMAEQTRMLCVPGSEVEDRQYQLNIRGFSVNTSTWQDFDRCLSLTSSQSTSLRTMSENPALEWNNLVSGKDSFTPHMSLQPVIAGLNLCVVAAPAIVYRGDILVCGHSLEVNAVTDIEVSVSTGQLLLASSLLGEILLLFRPLLIAPCSKQVTPEVQAAPSIKTLPEEASQETEVSIVEYSRFVDSGVDCADASSTSVMGGGGKRRELLDKGSSDIKEETKGMLDYDASYPFVSNRHRTPESPATEVTSKRTVSRKNALWNNNEHRRRDVVPVEILLTAGKISFTLYEVLEGDNSELNCFSSRLKQKLVAKHVHNKYDQNDDIGYEAGSEEGSVEDALPPRKRIQPLLYVLMAQPHAFLSLSFMRKMQISCFDMSIRLSEQDYVIPRGIPRPDDFSYILLETKGGDPHPDTGIPPAFLTVKWSESIGKASKIDLELGRPTKVHCSIPQWTFMEAVQRKVDFISCTHQTVSSESQSSFELITLESSKDSFDTCTHSSDLGTEVDTAEQQNKRLRIQNKELRKIQKMEFSNVQTGSARSSNLSHESSSADTKKSDTGILEKIGGVSGVSISSQQLVFQVSGTKHGADVVMSVAGLTGAVNRIVRGQVDRVAGNLSINCLMLTTACEGFSRPLLNPWSCNVDVCLAWEPWLLVDSPPQVQLTAESDCIMIDVGPEHLRSLHLIWSEYEPFLKLFTSESETEMMKFTHHSVDQDQHYRDDLRAGAFQFVDASSGSSRDDVPLPYQVVFWQAPPTMAWRYPQPRALTRVDIFPVPFKVAMDHAGKEPKGQVLCSLQYWSDCRACYQPYAQFQLSESEMCRLELPVPPHQVVACTWRVQLSLQTDEDDEAQDSRNILVSPRALAACMRVDSFFAPHQVPSFQAALNISSLQIALYNHMTTGSAAKPLPSPLKQFSVDQSTPESQCFMSFALDNSSLYVCTWSSGDTTMVELGGHVRCDIIDYAYLTQQNAIEPFQAKVQLTISETTALSCVTKPIAIRLGPAIGHTLAVSAQVWSQALNSFDTDGDTPVPNDECQVIISRYVVCNDMTRPLRFGQASTDENILLGSRQCHFYSWRTQKAKQVLRVGVEEGAWVWSQPFCIDTDGVQLCALSDCGAQDLSVVVSVKSLSATQKQVTLSGQLVVTNVLAEHLECRIMSIVDDSSVPPSEGQNLIAWGRSTPPSMLMDANSKVSLRIRFHGLDSVWSGDIPLRDNCKSGQPWLVKVPLHDRGQFLSVWCRVLCQHIGRGVKILAMLCPLYMIRSYLPVPAKVLVDTPGLKVHLQATINGRGEQQQLYCPGTVDHSHKLTFQLENGVPPSNPYVPLSYTMIDQRKFSRIDDKDIDIDVVLSSLNDVKSSGWPFIGEEYINVSWVAAEQPETHVQVKYVPLGPYCSTLLVELQPWALLVNVLGYPVVLLVEDCIVCRIPHQGVVTPPKLEHTFNLGLDVDDVVHTSSPLQLARPDWGSNFYMPRISGLIPVNGNIQTVVQREKTVGFLNIASTIVEEMRVITVRASYIICNLTPFTLQVSALAIRESETSTGYLKDDQHCVQTVLPDSEEKNNFGRSIVHWTVLGKTEGDGEFISYIMLNSGAGWSCPLRVNVGVARRSFTIPVAADNSGLSNSAYVLTVQEHSGQVFLSVYPEIHPQITVHNMCRFNILCAQGTPDNDGTAVLETAHLSWWCGVAPHSSSHYSFPAASERFPDIVSPGNWPPLVLALSDMYPPEEGAISWSRGISITETQEQFVRLPGHGDVKVRVEVQCHTSHVTVETVSHVEISARDIRSRLLRHQEDSAPSVEILYHRDSLLQSSPSCTSSYLSASSLSHSGTENVKNTETGMTFSNAVDSNSSVVQESSTSSVSSLLTLRGLNPESDIEEAVLPSRAKHIHLTCVLRGLSLTLTEDVAKGGTERTEVILLSLDNVCVCVKPQVLREDSEELDVSVSIGDLQLDNQMFQRGGFDFPVILIGQVPKHNSRRGFSLSSPATQLLEEVSSDALIVFRASFERLNSSEHNCTVMKQLNISLGPLCAYIEDTLITRLTDYLLCLLPPKLVFFPPSDSGISFPARVALVPVPKVAYWNSRQVAFPLRLRTLTVQPLSLLLSVHTSVKLYIALDHSPLQFSAFERRALITTPYRLGHTLTMHYLLGAIFGAGWMVGSLELLGSPGGFARTLGSGLRDFVSLPYRGIFEGPWGFLVGVTHGSASLMKHVTAGTLTSVTKLAESVARNLDRLTLDQEHLARTEELRRQRPQGVTQGLVQGLTGLGISLLGAVGGIAHHPLQSVMSEGPSTRGLVTGVGLGLVGAITKPLSGAAELVALTGQGLLHGAGWTTLPEVRQQPLIEHAFSGTNSRLKYNWKFVAGLGAGRQMLLHMTEATCITPSGSYEAVALVLTTRALFLVDTEEDVTRRVLSLTELSGIEHPSDPTLLCFRLQTAVENDATSRARVADFVRRSSGMVVDLTHDSTQSEAETSLSGSPVPSESPSSTEAPLIFYVNPQSRNYFLAVLALAKRQNQGRGFSVF
ncbi:intermembrane lipid transfer protein VPS13B isoform X2 [Periplaneta americana]|uniref:intermembrane lipid transfer protein VPS13B isoform X2 n=1 Tax=Periplaneta americana TaxID=6978 RepID=UPI0037E9B724